MEYGYILMKNILPLDMYNNINYKMIYVTLYVVILSLVVRFNKKYTLLSLWVLNLIVFTLMYNDLFIYMLYICIPTIISSVILIRSMDFDFSKMFDNEYILGDRK